MPIPSTEAEWDAAVELVTRAMMLFVAPTVTPISRVLSQEEGELLGTGSYLADVGERFLITNEHNVAALETHSLGLQFHGNDHVFKLHNSAPAIAYPADCALSLISDRVWSGEPALQPHYGKAIPIAQFADRHVPVAEELLFFRGYAGVNSRFMFDHLASGVTSYTTKETALPSSWGDGAYHFAIHYPPEKAVALDRGSGLPLPNGFSGSLVWNTRYVECVTQGIDWSPDMAQLTGIVWGWPSATSTILCTRVEHVHTFMAMALETMRQRGELPSI